MLSKWIGRTLVDGYCNGYFGRDFDKEGAVIEAIGRDWVVIRVLAGHCHWGVFRGGKREIKSHLKEWTTPAAPE